MLRKPNPYPVLIHSSFEADLPPRPIRFKLVFRPIRNDYCDVTLTSDFDGKQNSYYSSNVSWFVDTLQENINGHLNVVLGARAMARAHAKKG